jgi:hypothetical protein
VPERQPRESRQGLETLASRLQDRIGALTAYLLSAIFCLLASLFVIAFRELPGQASNPNPSIRKKENPMRKLILLFSIAFGFGSIAAIADPPPGGGGGNPPNQNPPHHHHHHHHGPQQPQPHGPPA